MSDTRSWCLVEPLTNSGEIGSLCRPDLQSHVIVCFKRRGGGSWMELKKKDKPAKPASSALYALCIG